MFREARARQTAPVMSSVRRIRGFYDRKRHPMSFSAVPLEELHGALVLLGGRPRPEGSEILPLSGSRLLARVEPILTIREFANHANFRFTLRAQKTTSGVVSRKRHPMSF